jgi:hypothetical protein
MTGTILRASLCVGLLGVTSIALSQEQTTDSSSLTKPGSKWVEFRAGFAYDDDGFAKTDGTDGDSETVMKVTRAKAGWKGQVNEDVTAEAIWNGVSRQFDNLWAQYHVNPMFSIRVGQDKIQQSGYDVYMCNLDCIESGYLSDKGPFATFAPNASLRLKLAGEVILSVLNDVIPPDSPNTHNQGTTGSWNTDAEQPTFTLAYWGDLDGFKPMFQGAMYDSNHSYYWGLGLGFDIENIKGHLDYIMDTRNAKALDPDDGKNKDQTTTHSSYTIKLGYQVSKSIYPYLYYTTLTTTAKALGRDQQDPDDLNKSTIGLAAHFTINDAWSPYFGVFQKSANGFVDSAGAKESREQLEIKLGIFSKFSI